jgi:hypothetical protein
MTATNDFQSAVGKILTEIEVLNEEIDLVPKIITKQLNYSEDFEFRPLTKKEKKEFVNSLDARGKQILAELEGKPKRAPRRKLQVQGDPALLPSSSPADPTPNTEVKSFVS